MQKTKTKVGVFAGGIISAAAGSIMEYLRQLSPGKFLIGLGVLLMLWAVSDYLPFGWRGWNWREKQEKKQEHEPPPKESQFNVSEWQGREYYPLRIAAALWLNLEPLESTPGYYAIKTQYNMMQLAIMDGELECEDEKLREETPISRSALRKYAAKQGMTKLPQFLQ